jgi:hypothetical protein
MQSSAPSRAVDFSQNVRSSTGAVFKSGLQIIQLPLGILCGNRESGWKYGGAIVRKLFREP